MSEFEMKQRVKALSNITIHEEQLNEILAIFLELFPVKGAFLLRYSVLGFIGEGIIYKSSSSFRNISSLRDDIRSIPFVHEAITEKKAKYFAGYDFYVNSSNKYIIKESWEAVLVIPIVSEHLVIAYIICPEIEDNVEISDDFLHISTLFGQLIGRFLSTTFKNTNNNFFKLSKRELEVMHLICNGDSIQEIADTLGLKDVTIKQYIKTAIQKTGAKNRSHAISQLYKYRVLH